MLLEEWALRGYPASQRVEAERFGIEDFSGICLGLSLVWIKCLRGGGTISRHHSPIEATRYLHSKKDLFKQIAGLHQCFSILDEDENGLVAQMLVGCGYNPTVPPRSAGGAYEKPAFFQNPAVLDWFIQKLRVPPIVELAPCQVSEFANAQCQWVATGGIRVLPKKDSRVVARMKLGPSRQPGFGRFLSPGVASIVPVAHPTIVLISFMLARGTKAKPTYHGHAIVLAEGRTSTGRPYRGIYDPNYGWIPYRPDPSLEVMGHHTGEAGAEAGALPYGAGLGAAAAAAAARSTDDPDPTLPTRAKVLVELEKAYNIIAARAFQIRFKDTSWAAPI